MEPKLNTHPHTHSHSHAERHFSASEVIKDIVIGMADGLTVPFALSAGLSGAVLASHLVVTAGVAEIAAGAIAMGLGGYLAAKGDADHYAHERKREQYEVQEFERREISEVVEIFSEFGLSRDDCAPIIARFRANPEAWVDFMMRYELGLERPDPRRAWRSALTIGSAYVVGGVIPLLPYMLIALPQRALGVSALATLLALAIFGYVKGRLTGVGAVRGALQTTLIGSLASAAAYFLARAIS